MRKIKLAIIGAGKEGSSLYYCFRMKPNVEIVGIYDNTGKGTGLDEAISKGIPVYDNLEEIAAIKDLDIIVETTKDPQIAEKIRSLKKPETQVVEASSLELIVALGDKKERTEAELFSLIGSIHDAVMIVDRDGKISYANKVFERITGIAVPEIVGQNIFEVYPDSPVAHCLRTGQSFSGQKYSFGDSAKEYSYNVTPIIVRDNVTGVIGIFKVLPDIVKLMEELQKSSSIIEGLYDRLGHINGLAELNISDVMPIDKMEQIMLRQALTKYGYSVEGKKRAAKALNISLATLYNKLKKYQIS
ncbi:MAG: hypothetical protein CVU89_16635 [Firmicutes bacterium HGW-Firmicutes-14]|nr:MAG: hypothetical protein CVU89_16635 [Firmicutes bacterium HGW-Firmicutes-14]